MDTVDPYRYPSSVAHLVGVRLGLGLKLGLGLGLGLRLGLGLGLGVGLDAHLFRISRIHLLKRVHDELGDPRVAERPRVTTVLHEAAERVGRGPQ